MISVQQFSKDFYARHDFDYDDINFLPNKYRNIRFSAIPESWVIKIDAFLSKMNNIKEVKSISQIMGFISIESTCKGKDLELLGKLETCIKSLDIDLHNEIGESKILN